MTVTAKHRGDQPDLFFVKTIMKKKKIFSILKREININNYNSLSLHQVTGRNRGYYISKSNKKI